MKKLYVASAEISLREKARKANVRSCTVLYNRTLTNSIHLEVGVVTAIRHFYFFWKNRKPKNAVQLHG